MVSLSRFPPGRCGGVRIDRRLTEANLRGEVLMPGTRPLPDRPRCAHCGDVIGVYERFVTVTDSTARERSFVLEPDIACTGGASCYHVACYEAREIP